MVNGHVFGNFVRTFLSGDAFLNSFTCQESSVDTPFYFTPRIHLRGKGIEETNVYMISDRNLLPSSCYEYLFNLTYVFHSFGVTARTA